MVINRAITIENALVKNRCPHVSASAYKDTTGVVGPWFLFQPGSSEMLLQLHLDLRAGLVLWMRVNEMLLAKLLPIVLWRCARQRWRCRWHCRWSKSDGLTNCTTFLDGTDEMCHVSWCRAGCFFVLVCFELLLTCPRPSRCAALNCVANWHRKQDYMIYAVMGSIG